MSDKRIECWVSQEQLAVIDEAAKADGRSRANFISFAVMKEARAQLKEAGQ